MRGFASLSRFTIVASLGLAAAGCDAITGSKASFTITLSEQSASVGQGATKTITVNVARSDFDKPVTLAVDGLPAGVTGTFTPTPVAASGTSSVLELVVAGTAVPATSTLTVRATGEGVAQQTAELSLTITVTGSFSLSALEAPITVSQGGGGNTSVLVNRIGGFGGNVALTLAGAPAGITATSDVASTAGNSFSLAIAANASVAAGTYALTATGTSAGLPNQTAQISFNVIAPPPTASLTLPFCATQTPVWLAFKNEGFAWQQVAPAGSTFSFAATERLAIAYTYSNNNGTQVNVFYSTRAELSAFTDRDCGGTKSLSGTVAGLASGQIARIVMGISGTSVSSPATTFSFSALNNRSLDLVATRGVSTSAGLTPDKMIIRRSLDLATGSAIPALDFAAAEAFSPALARIDVTGTVSGEDLILVNTLWSVTSSFGAVHSFSPSPSNSVFHVPEAQLVTGDLHELYIGGELPSGTAGHSFVGYQMLPADRTVALGPSLSTPAVSIVSTSPYLRMRGRTPVQSDYGSTARFGFFQAPSSGGTRLVYVVLTAGYLGGAPATSWDHVVPDFGAVGGFNVNWMLTAGTQVQYIAEAYAGRTELLFGSRAVEADVLRYAYRVAATPASGLRAARSVMSAVRGRPQYLSR